MNRAKLTSEERLALAKMEAEVPFIAAGKHLSGNRSSKSATKVQPEGKRRPPRKVASAA